MKTKKIMADWMWICVLAAVALLFIFGLYSCLDSHDKERRQWAKDNPVEAAQNNCYSKVRGSRPACWSEADWIVYCKYVQCKQQ
mgnify:CR=1 FL=1